MESDWDDGRAAIADNAWYPSLFSGADPRGDVTIQALDVESISGLRGPDAEPAPE